MTASSAPLVLLTAFGPFKGRAVNASSIGTTAVAASRFDVRRVVCDVVWGQPAKTVLPELGRGERIVLSFGEATDTFRLELVARNERGAAKTDETGSTPAEPLIRPGGPDTLQPLYNHDRVKAALNARGFPIELSHNAGQFLCDEMFFTLLDHQRNGVLKHPLDIVAFIHIPVFNRETKVFGADGVTLESAVFDEALAARFVQACVDVMIAEHVTMQERLATHKRGHSD
jgi:pyroglutamyl-peptidase